MDRLSFEEQLEDLRNISGTVDDYIVRGLYIHDTGIDSAYQPNQILAECYDIIIDELYEYGISFIEDNSDLLSDWYTAKHIYYIRTFIDADNLMRLLSVRQDLDTLATIVDTEDYSDLFQRVVDFMFTRTTADIYHILSDMSNRLTVDESFSAHILACIQRVTETGSVYQIPPEELPQVRNYIAKVCKSRDVIKRAIMNLRGEVDPVAFATYLPMGAVNRFIQTYDLDKIDPSHVRDFAALDTDLCLDPVALKEIEENHHRHSLHHVEYYIANESMIDITSAIFIFVALIGEVPSIEEFADKADKTIKLVNENKTSDWDIKVLKPLITFLTKFLRDELKDTNHEVRD